MLSSTTMMLYAPQAIFQWNYSLNRVQGWACRRPSALRVVLQEVNHCLPDCPQFPVRSYKSKSRSWLWLQVYVPQQTSQAQSPRTVKAATPFTQLWVHSCSLTGCAWSAAGTYNERSHSPEQVTGYRIPGKVTNLMCMVVRGGQAHQQLHIHC